MHICALDPEMEYEDLTNNLVESHSVRPAGEKIFHIKMTRLAEEMNVKRIYVSKALNELQSEGLIRLERGRIYIPALENLIKR